MKKKIVTLLLVAAMTGTMVVGCGSKADDKTADTKTEQTDDKKDTEEKKENPLWKQLLAVEDKKGIAKALWKFIKRMAKGILPGHLIIKGTFGTGDPVWTEIGRASCRERV